MDYKIAVDKRNFNLQSLREVADDIFEVFKAVESIAPEMFKGAYFLDSKKKDWQWQDEATKQILVDELLNLQKGKIRYWYKIKHPTPEHKQVEGYSFTFYLSGYFGMITFRGGGNRGSGFRFDFRIPVSSEVCSVILKKIVNIYKPMTGFVYENIFTFSDIDSEDFQERRAAWISYFDDTYTIPSFDFEVAYRKKELNGEFIKTVEGGVDNANPVHIEKAMQMVNFLIKHRIFSQ